MPLKLMYITNDPKVAIIAERAGVDRIFIDMEYIGKSDRQGGLNTVQSHHTIDDIKNIRSVISKAELLVRVNPIHDGCSDYYSSEEEISYVIEKGADIVMLPYFKKAEEVKRFLSIVGGRVKTMLLVETPDAVENIDEILSLKGIDYIHIGINDLGLGYNKKFMFELVADKTVERLCKKCKKANIPYGFGGIASLGKGMLPSELVIKEHYRVGSSCAILSRSFCNTSSISDIKIVEDIFNCGVKEIREYEKLCENCSESDYQNNFDKIVSSVKKISEGS